MINLNKIFEDFKEGNTEQQLESYMFHRDLRPDFDQIEKDELSSKMMESSQIVIKPIKSNHKKSLFTQVKHWGYSIISLIK